MRHQALLALTVLVCLDPLCAQRRPRPRPPAPAPLPPAVPLGEAATKVTALRFAEAEHWMQKCVTLLSLNHHWHPVGRGMVLEALRDKDRRMRAFGVETLLRTDAEVLRAIVDAELAEELIKQSRDRNEYYQSRVLAVLAQVVPDAGADDHGAWQKWWRQNAEGFEPGVWPEPERPKRDGKGGGTVVQSVTERAFDLYQRGLDVVISIDSTGSMQSTIDAARDALGSMLEILEGVSPKLRMGLVHYRDLGDMSDGARLLKPLSRRVKDVRKELASLIAGGGGDAPERVANGLEIALSRKMRWAKKTNKLVIIIGDAPAQDIAKAVQLAERGLDQGRGRRGPTTGPKKPGKAAKVIVSCIGVNAGPADHFKQIAKAGGGSYAQIGAGRRAPGIPRGPRGPRGGASSKDATRNIVEHILVLSFGERFRREMRAFVEIFFEYQKAGLIR